MNVTDIEKNAEQKVQKSVEALKTGLAKIRTGHVHTGLLDRIQVGYYGSMVPTGQVANATLMDARATDMQPWGKRTMQTVEKAIREVDLGLNLAAMGDIIRVPTPALIEERHKELIKVVRGEGEDAKIAMYSLRRDVNEQLKKLVENKTTSEDDERHDDDDVQKLTGEFAVEIDKLVVEKDKEIMTV